MFTTETGIGVVVMIVFAVFWLAFMLWEDWGQAGKTARARASAKANGWEQDEMQNTITRNGAIIAYRLMTVGLFVVMLVDIIAFGKNVSEFAIRVHGVRGCLQNNRDLPCRKRRRGRSAV